MTRRSDVLQKVLSTLRGSGNAALHATPGMGKSWLLDRVGDGLATVPGAPNVVSRIDLSTFSRGAEVFEHLADVDGTEPPSEAAGRTRAAWRAARMTLEARGARTFLLIDQFDYCIHYDDAHDFLIFLRELIHRPEHLGCNAVIASRRTLASIEAGVRGISSLDSVCYTYYLGPLEPDDLTSFDGANSLLEDEVRTCIDWSAGHPSLAKYWLATRPGDIDFDGNQERVKSFLSVVDYLGQSGLLQAAAQYCLGSVTDDWISESGQLALLGLIDLDDRAKLTNLSQHLTFQDALRSRTANMNPWGLMGEVEVRLRGVIESVLLDAYGSLWADVVGKKSPSIRTMQELAAAKAARDLKQFGLTLPWLAYTYPADLWKVLSTEWQHFSGIFFGGDKNYWRVRFEGLGRYRAPLAHGRVEMLSANERVQCKLFADAILQRLNQWAADGAGEEAAG